MSKSDGAAPVVISEPGQLKDLARSRAFTAGGPWVLRLEGLAENEAFGISERLNRERTECGCSLGAKAMTLGFILAVVALAVMYGASWEALVRVPIVFAVTLASAAAGKVVGIALARRRARRVIARLERRFASAG